MGAGRAVNLGKGTSESNRGRAPWLRCGDQTGSSPRTPAALAVLVSVHRWDVHTGKGQRDCCEADCTEQRPGSLSPSGSALGRC